MNPEVERLLELAANVPAGQRAKVLAEACPESALRAEVESLLQYESGAEAYLAGAIQGVAQSLRNVHDASPGDVIGCYRIVSLIGRGGMGSVYLAERADGEIHQRVAIKLLRADGHRPAWLERFRKERQLLASLQHPSIVHVIDAGHTADGRPFLVMEYVDGVAIDAYAAGIDVRSRLRLFLRVCEGVSHAHQHLVIHCDLKPSNILVDGSGQPKLLDFGVAKLLEDGDTTQIGERLLTPNYASPEQLSGGTQTTATDIYSLGVVLYRLLVGAAPRRNDSAAPNSGILPPSRANRDVPGDVDYIFRKAVRAEPGERYATVDELAADVRAVLAWRPVQARSGDIWYRARRFLRRYWVPAIAAALVMASLAAGLLVANRQRVLAERRFAQLRHLAGKVIDVDRTIRNLPGSMEARQRLVKASLEYLEGLAPEAGESLGLAREIGEGYWRLGRIQGVNAEPNLGDPVNAEDSLKKADALIDVALASRPQDRDALFLSALIAHDRMILANSSERQADALVHSARAIARLEAFQRRDDPRNPVRLEGFLRAGDARQSELSGVALLYVNVALTYVNLQRYDDGARFARRAAELVRPVSSAQDLYAAGMSVLANALRYQGDLEAALKTIREAREISERAVYPSAPARLFNRFGPLLREGMILGEEDAVSLERPEEAAEALQKALDLMDEAASRDPNDSASRSRLGTAALELGGVLHDRDPRRALAVYDKGIHRLTELGQRPEALRDRALLLANSSYPLRRLHRVSEARTRIGTALAMLKDTKDYPTDQIRLGSPVDKVLCALADHEAEAGDPRRALDMYRQLIDKILKTGPDATADLKDSPKLTRRYAAIATLYRRIGDSAAAKVVNTRSLELWRHWQQKQPQNAYIRHQLQIAAEALDR